jgi:hypothetical protein
VACSQLSKAFGLRSSRWPRQSLLAKAMTLRKTGLPGAYFRAAIDPERETAPEHLLMVYQPEELPAVVDIRRL